ncbi:unnamed protein product [Paramecium pentaurelia]|uniref:Uncharacterized protein n=1 Tax=Paramecium pentaurelia TaxID=43138 RepID=A0A8S1XMP1_9CILI|nr:unnamed protein product [Paramecium pentaurelia]
MSYYRLIDILKDQKLILKIHFSLKNEIQTKKTMQILIAEANSAISSLDLDYEGILLKVQLSEQSIYPN